MEKERLHYIDAAKGILILIVVLRHIENYLRFEHCLDLPDNHIRIALSEITNPLITFYMPAFFVITGFCTNFQKEFKQFLWGNIKTLLLPAVTLGIIALWLNYLFSTDASVPAYCGLYVLKGTIINGGIYWFLTALFICKILLWLMLHFTSQRTTYLLSIGCFVVASFAAINNIPCRWWLIHALILVSFMLVGCKLKANDCKSIYYISGGGIRTNLYSQRLLAR